MNNKILLTLVVSICFFSQALASEWAEVARGNPKFPPDVFASESIDIESIRKSGDYVRYWTRTKRTDKNGELLNGKDVLDAAYLYKSITVNCEQGTSAITHMSASTSKGISIPFLSESDKNLSFKENVPGSSQDHKNTISCAIEKGASIPTEKTVWTLDLRTKLEYASNTTKKTDGAVTFWLRQPHAKSAAYFKLICNENSLFEIGNILDYGDLMWLDLYRKPIEKGNLKMEFLNQFCN